MDKSSRTKFNQSWTEEQYQLIDRKFQEDFKYAPSFRISETPVFLNNDFKKKLEHACDDIVGQVMSDEVRNFSKSVFDICPYKVPGDDAHCPFLQMDFGVVDDGHGAYIPKLIELQGFPSLYYFQPYLADRYKQAYNLKEGESIFFSAESEASYFDDLKKLILADCKPEEVVMIDIKPEEQNTYIDFLCTRQIIGIKILCISDIKVVNKKLYYIDDQGETIRIKRIYNRIIFDELASSNIESEFKLTDEVDVEWVNHPNWFFTVSKYILPKLSGPYVPRSYFLSDVNLAGLDLENFVLKPLFSFAGAGVDLDPSVESLNAIADKNNYILQEKVIYAPLIETLDVGAKCEIRAMFLWDKKEERPRLVSNLLRMSKGKMIGVKYNKNKSWVGASVGFFKN